jgi:LPXTG-motif cell wall-anchored protein
VLVHAFLGLWMLEHLTSQTLFWALGAILVVAVLHALSPLWVARVRPETGSAGWTHCLPPIALVMMLVPIFKLTEVSIFIWPLIFLIDLLAIGLAWVTRSLISVLAVLLITGVVGASWIFRLPSTGSDLSLLLVIVGAMAVFFLFAGMFVLRRILSSASSAPGDLQRAFGGLTFTQDNSNQALMAQLPALSAMMPFLLLVLIVVHLRLPNPSPVFALAMALTILLLSIARAFQKGGLALVALGSVVLLQLAWHGRAFDPAVNAPIALAWNGAFGVLIFAFPFLSRDRFLTGSSAWAASALSFPLHFYGIYRTIQTAWPNPYPGILPAALALPAIGALVLSAKIFTPQSAQRNAVLAWYGGVALFFVTLIFPIQFDRQWITVSWALEGAALCWLFRRVPHPGLRWTGAGLLVVSFIRLALNPAVLSYHPRSETALLNWYLYSFGLVTAALFAAGRLLAPPRDRAGQLSFPALFDSLGTILLFLLVNVEIADYFTTPGNAVLTFQFGGNFARDMSYTIAWGVFALGLVSAGMWWGLKAARYAGLALIGVTLLKLFFHDLNRLGPLYRIGALAGVAVVAILASVLYQKFVASEDKKTSAPTPPHP